MPMRVVTFKVDECIVKELDQVAKAQHVTRSEVIREAIERYLREQGLPLPRRPRHSPTVLRHDSRALVFEVEV
ncbi:ribbon-helix-helix protein, CopG family [Pyrodictium abyssi]|uniref:Ribbon-helix-helix protein CopG domain-containing protein n=1 Tax=Pyrodictium abyssi TaxID=54256 RepID=A0ABM8J066_9CREN|nr:hypothetical protein PABY_21590 [Pyrodictium abyssi]